jgi:hypothetical protein
VTSERIVIKQFTLGKLFFMFDSLHRVTVMKLPNHEDMASINGFPLVSVNESSELEAFGCEINGFSDFYNLTEDYDSNDYLLLYHCTPPESEYWELRVSKISLWTEWDDNEMGLVPRYRIDTYNGSV